MWLCYYVSGGKVEGFGVLYLNLGESFLIVYMLFGRLDDKYFSIKLK